MILSIIGIVLGITAIGLFIWLKNDQKMSDDLHEHELQHTHQGMNALMEDFNNFQVETDRKITELEKQLVVRSKEHDRKVIKITESLPAIIRNVVGHIEFARPLDKK